MNAEQQRKKHAFNILCIYRIEDEMKSESTVLCSLFTGFSFAPFGTDCYTVIFETYVESLIEFSTCNSIPF